MIYDLRHLTTYHYGKPVSFARCSLRLPPRLGADQTVSDYALTITPAPGAVTHPATVRVAPTITRSLLRCSQAHLDDPCAVA